MRFFLVPAFALAVLLGNSASSASAQDESTKPGANADEKPADEKAAEKEDEKKPEDKTPVDENGDPIPAAADEAANFVYTTVLFTGANDALHAEFGTTLSQPDVHIMDPFTGTGTFIVRLIETA